MPVSTPSGNGSASHSRSFYRAVAERRRLFWPNQNESSHSYQLSQSAAVAETSATNWLYISPQLIAIGTCVSRLFQECSIRDAALFAASLLFHTELSGDAWSLSWVCTHSKLSHNTFHSAYVSMVQYRYRNVARGVSAEVLAIVASDNHSHEMQATRFKLSVLAGSRSGKSSLLYAPVQSTSAAAGRDDRLMRGKFSRVAVQ